MNPSEAGPPEARPTVLVVDDDALYGTLLVQALRARLPDTSIEVASSHAGAVRRISRDDVVALILDVALPDGDGFGVVRAARRGGREIPFVFLSADGSAGTAVRALQAGALDYLVKDAGATERLARAVRGVVDARRSGADDGRLVGTSVAIERVRTDVHRCARSEAPVRIEGETGVGKELVARSIHEASARRRGPFVAVNCGALPEGLAEAELFGHVRGAYTGAGGDRAGLIEHAAGGSLLLDELEDLPLVVQGKLLRLIQEGEYRPVGTPRTRRANVRLLAASNRDLAAMVEQGGFRRDLYYRLDVLRVRVPPLRARPTDVAALVVHLLHRRVGRVVDAAMLPLPHELARLGSYAWPGNVRELENVVERARVVAEVSGWRAGWAAAVAQLDGVDSAHGAGAGVAEPPSVDPERVALEAALGRHRWRREAVARELGISRVTLWRRMRRVGLIGET